MRYQRIYTQIWFDEKFTTLSENAKFLFLYLLTCPHSNALGIFVLPKGYICEDLGWSMERLNKPFAELLSQGFILYDERVKLICIKNHLKHNPIENQNQVKSAKKILEQLPKSSLFLTILEQLNKEYHKPLRELLQERYSKPETETETYTETEKEKDIYIAPSNGNSSEPEPIKPEDVFIHLPLNDGTEYPITKDQIEEFRELYPAVDIEQALRDMRGWCVTNPRKRKTKHGILRFINGWLAKEQDRGGGQIKTPTTKPSKYSVGAFEWLRQKKQQQQGGQV